MRHGIATMGMALWLAGCMLDPRGTGLQDEPLSDAGPGPDAAGHDAGRGRDGGPGHDAGPGRDAGPATGRDAGPGTDAGPPTLDAGPPDAGRYVPPFCTTGGGEPRLCIPCDGDAYDHSTYGHAMTAVRVSGSAAGMVGTSCAYGTGTTHFALAAPTLDTPTFTVEFFVRLNDLPARETEYMLAMRDGQWSISVLNNGTVHFTGPSTFTEVSRVFDTDVWTHVAIARDASNLVLFIDGARSAELTVGAATTPPPANILFAPEDLPMYALLDGVLDEIRLFGIRRTDEDIADAADRD